MGIGYVAGVAHELRRDYERGVFDRQMLAIIGGSSTVAVAAIAKGAYSFGVIGLLTAALFIYQPAQADRRWRDERRVDP
ncbi:hypothetical protein GS429_12155 [Natronorubrum sp. JWXQ-INN-674]|uniref:Uncharacterized protein n=1 Tax=Natronorubrum halalkaliphilum TaxID=2691917 RepID=A0A6B0VMM9_9EURY|nr:hypothetical protein [Natronorubrum halalkaliphilum]